MSREEVIDRYCAAWSDSDPDRRRVLLEGVWGNGASYTDPTVHAAGAGALLDHITETLARRPGTRVSRTSELQAHHDAARFAWKAITPDGTTLVDGLDVAIFDEEGRISRIIGFFGSLGDRS